MASFKSDLLTIERPDSFVFSFLSDFNNFSQLMPPQVTDWQSDGESCSFNIQNMATLGMRYSNKQPNNLISIVSDGKVPFNFNLQCAIDARGEKACDVVLELNADLNPMMMMMASRPLANFVNILAQKLREICESGRI